MPRVALANPPPADDVLARMLSLIGDQATTIAGLRTELAARAQSFDLLEARVAALEIGRTETTVVEHDPKTGRIARLVRSARG